MSENKQDKLTEEELAETRRLIRMSQLARILWSMVIGLVSLISAIYVLADQVHNVK
jgi:hypothetical protein